MKTEHEIALRDEFDADRVAKVLADAHEKLGPHDQQASDALMKGALPHKDPAIPLIDGLAPGRVKTLPIKLAGPKVGRNDLCPCGSGEKYKRCCIARTRTEKPVHQWAAYRDKSRS